MPHSFPRTPLPCPAHSPSPLPPRTAQASSGVKQWNKRWFVLVDRCLFYYKGELASSPGAGQIASLCSGGRWSVDTGGGGAANLPHRLGQPWGATDRGTKTEPACSHGHSVTSHSATLTAHPPGLRQSLGAAEGHSGQTGQSCDRWWSPGAGDGLGKGGRGGNSPVPASR